jgi:hypothetical protein
MLQYSEVIQKRESRMSNPALYFFRRLTTANAVRPSMIPAIMDSHGKPGTAGRTIGVETEIVVELLVVVGVLTTVIVETDVLTTVVVSELVVIPDVVDAFETMLLVANDEVVVATEFDVELELELELELVLVTC